MKPLLIITFILNTMSLSGQKNNYSPFQQRFQESPGSELNLYGKVSSIKIEQLIYYYDNNKQKISEKYVSGTEAGFKRSFDNKRKIIRQIAYDTDSDSASKYYPYPSRISEWC